MDFDSLLRDSLAVVNDGYQTAFSDLTEIVGGVAAAIKRNAGERFDLRISELASDMKGTTFRIIFDTDVRNARARMMDVLFLRIPAQGYPVLIGSYDKLRNNFFPDSEAVDKDAVQKIFAALIMNPDSSLIQAIGFALRAHDDIEDDPF